MYFTKEQIDKIIADHARWLRCDGGARANLAGANLARSNLAGANLAGANLDGVYLDGKKIKTAVFSSLYRYTVWAVLFQDGSKWIRMGCLWKSVEEWTKNGIAKSNEAEFPDDGSAKSRQRIAAFNFAMQWFEWNV